MNNKKGNFLYGYIMLAGFVTVFFLFLMLFVILISETIINSNIQDYCKDNGYEQYETRKFDNNFVCVGTKKIPNEIGYEMIRSNIIKYEDIKNGRKTNTGRD